MTHIYSILLNIILNIHRCIIMILFMDIHVYDLYIYMYVHVHTYMYMYSSYSVQYGHIYYFNIYILYNTQYVHVECMYLRRYTVCMIENIFICITITTSKVYNWYGMVHVWCGCGVVWCGVVMV